MTSLDDLEKEKTLMVLYLRRKLENEDWHGVQDAASDIRDIEAKMEGIKECLESQKPVADAVSNIVELGSLFPEEEERMGFSLLGRHWDRMK